MVVGAEDEILVSWDEDAAALWRGHLQEDVSRLVIYGADSAEKNTLGRALGRVHDFKAYKVLPREVFIVDVLGRESLGEEDLCAHELTCSISAVDILELHERHAVRAEAPFLKEEGYKQTVQTQEEVVGIHAIPDIVGELERQFPSHAMCARERTYFINLGFCNHGTIETYWGLLDLWGLFYSLNHRSQSIQTLVDGLVAAVDLLDIADGAGALGAHGSDEQGDAGTDIG